MQIFYTSISNHVKICNVATNTHVYQIANLYEEKKEKKKVNCFRYKNFAKKKKCLKSKKKHAM